jgi:hypothetical protein
MNLVQSTKDLPRFGERVLVKTGEGYFFTAKLERDEEGDFWVYDLPVGMITDSFEIKEEIVSWSYLNK